MLVKASYQLLFNVQSARYSVKMNREDIQLSDYDAARLENMVKLRYIEKISVIDIDPFLLPTNSLDPVCLPPVESFDVVSFLVHEHSFYTKETFKNYKALQAYNQVISKFVTSVQGKKINDCYLVVGNVLHSQKINEKPVQCWIITNNQGVILFTHSLCMAGLCECCFSVISF